MGDGNGPVTKTVDENRRDWVDTISKLLIPLVICFVGVYFTTRKDKSDDAFRRYEQNRTILGLAVSDKEAERALALNLIDIRQKKGEFPEELSAALNAVASRPPFNELTQEAKNLQSKQTPQSIAPPSASTLPYRVYIEIARDDQRSEARELQGKLETEGFSVKGIEVLSSISVNTYVRCFSDQDEPRAKTIAQTMNQMGIPAEVQIPKLYNQDGKLNGTFEVWIGSKHIPVHL